ncbi:MAG: four helix bundle protein, partial [Dehalococcoidia bacterium]
MGNGQSAMGEQVNGRYQRSASIASYYDLDVWKIAMDLAVDCYGLTRGFPRDELFGLTSQIRRASASVPANIAEGYGRDNRGDYVHHLRIAQGSLKELETHLILASRVGIVTTEQLDPILSRADRTGRLLRS